MGEIKDGFDKAKAWWESKTIIAIILGVVSTILGLFGFDIGNVVGLVFDEAENVAGQVDSLWVGLQAVFFSIVAAWGRIKAEVKIKA